jgi:hypothetical protein
VNLAKALTVMLSTPGFGQDGFSLVITLSASPINNNMNPLVPKAKSFEISVA